MEKAIRLLSYLIDYFALTDPSKVMYIQEVKADLEEAMKPKTCNECEWWDFNSYGIFKKCFNGEVS